MKRQMKRQTILIPLLVVLCGRSYAQTYYIEEDNAYQPLPAEVKQAVESFKGGAWSKELFENCTLVGAPIDIALDGQMAGYLVSSNGCGGGSASMPVWLVAKTNAVYSVVLSYGAVMLTLSNQQTNGFRNIVATQQNAGHCEAIQLHYNGKAYVEVARQHCQN